MVNEAAQRKLQEMKPSVIGRFRGAEDGRGSWYMNGIPVLTNIAQRSLAIGSWNAL
jgi:hypothetical protein